MDAIKGLTQAQQVCTSTSIQTGDQLMAFLPHTGNQTSLRLQVERSSTAPYTIRTNLFGAIPLAFDTFRQDVTPWTLLKAPTGESAITVPIASS